MEDPMLLNTSGPPGRDVNAEALGLALALAGQPCQNQKPCLSI